MNKTNKVFIATSLDGFIAGKKGELDWLNSIPNPDNLDMGYKAFMKNIDALVMGRVTFETVCSFDLDWPYDKPVFVLSSTMNRIPESHKGKAFLTSGSLKEILNEIHEKGFNRLYIDGGGTIQSFLKADLIDELVITRIPILLGGGFPLFSDMPEALKFDLLDSKVFLNQITQNHYKRRR